jgi:hypothetical protein
MRTAKSPLFARGTFAPAALLSMGRWAWQDQPAAPTLPASHGRDTLPHPGVPVWGSGASARSIDRALRTRCAAPGKWGTPPRHTSRRARPGAAPRATTNVAARPGLRPPSMERLRSCPALPFARPLRLLLSSAPAGAGRTPGADRLRRARACAGGSRAAAPPWGAGGIAPLRAIEEHPRPAHRLPRHASGANASPAPAAAAPPPRAPWPPSPSLAAASGRPDASARQEILPRAAPSDAPARWPHPCAPCRSRG